ncbi:hypothetical protein BV22DRAFT_1039273 [Leucogyrophana mollusca]|uniref:Uncharacterized protein n=1 Tax=Leucogyrophana mollusca TaxID=85980 RepID=A0ACB8B564_9AGAM|nr:hypothetical protein BV22DRAFT_1039273 [Leucogyrophana mollusca]
MLCERVPVSPPSRSLLKRPRGSWNLKGSTTPPRHVSPPGTFWLPDCGSSPQDLTEDEGIDSPDEGSNASSNGSSSKRRRISRDLDGFSAIIGHEDSDTTANTTLLLSPGLHSGFSKLMNGAPAANIGEEKVVVVDCPSLSRHDDWQLLKDLSVKAIEQYDACTTGRGTSCAEALAPMRESLHRCHRFLLLHHDHPFEPSLTGTHAHTSKSPRTTTPTDDFATNGVPARERHLEHPTAFHAILGMCLFFCGNLLAHDPLLALPGEPATLSYWLAALDVFATADNLPARTDGLYSDVSEDWHMIIVWGLVLVAIAKHTLPPTTSSDPTAAPSLPPDDPRWPPDSLFGAISARRPPLTQRMILSKTTTHELMMLAMDQFTRGILHMPRQPTPNVTVSRDKELLTIASEVLDVAERLDSSADQRYWAAWVGTVLDMMKLEVDADLWRGEVDRARGRCAALLGTTPTPLREDQDEMQQVECTGISGGLTGDALHREPDIAEADPPSRAVDISSMTDNETPHEVQLEQTDNDRMEQIG